MTPDPVPPDFVDAAPDTALVRIGDIRLRYRRNDGGGTHYLGRGHSEEYHSPFYPLLGAALAPAACIDIGANYGFTGLLMRRAFPQAHLTLVEPVPWLEAYVRHNFALNGQTFGAFHSAICSAADTGPRSAFGVRERATQDSRVIPQPGMSVVETAVVTLDDLAATIAPDEGPISRTTPKAGRSGSLPGARLSCRATRAGSSRPSSRRNGSSRPLKKCSSASTKCRKPGNPSRNGT